MRNLCLTTISLFSSSCLCDSYIQHPRGSNNKLNEQSDTVQNANRLFDSQNNAQSGYQVGDNCFPNCLDDNGQGNNNYKADMPGAGEGVMQYYEGSFLWIEWTMQHGSQSQYLHNNMVLQYTCDDSKYTTNLRDGKTRTTIPFDPEASKDPKYGQHETYEWYANCVNRTRNTRLFVADQTLQGTTARFTRQNNNGNRHGFECPEERDYYPYFHPTPWRDIWVCTDKPGQMCPLYQSQSQNVMSYGSCSISTYNNQKDCQYNQGVWTVDGAWNVPAPNCTICPKTRNNHNGNADGDDQSPHYAWQIPKGIHTDGAKCVIRLRYNITTNEYDGFNTFSTSNGANSPVKGNPVSEYLGLGQNVSGPLKLNINTAQFGRTFEDRTHVFQIRKRPSDLTCGLRASENCNIYNLNVRGRRGNIQQTYPAVEYDFVPPNLVVSKNDYIHVQWTGSDANDQNNAGNGKAGTDRSNLVIISSLASNVPTTINPLYPTNSTPLHFTNDMSKVAKMAYLGQNASNCNPDTANANDNANCKILNNAPAYFNLGLVKAENLGVFHIMSTRNNAFSNRDQKTTITVIEDSITIAAATVISFAGFGILAAAGFFGLRFLKRNPNSKLAVLAAKYHLVKSTDGNFSEADDEATSDSIWEKYAILRKFAEWYSWNQPRFWFAFFFLSCQVGSFLYGYLINLGNPLPYYVYAKGFGKMLDVNLNIILIPVLRNFMSYLRTTPIVDKLPLDDNILIHKWTAYTIAFSAIGHIGFHFADFSYQNYALGVPIYMSVFATVSGLTGLLVTGMIMTMFSTAFLKRKIYTWIGKRFDGYKVFLSVHRLWMPIYALLWLHGSQFWQFTFVIMIFMFFEKYIQHSRVKVDVRIIEGKLVGKDVLCLKMKLNNTKKKFRYKAGQYLFLCCPDITESEYHPFTITSAPEDSYFSCHIRCRSDMDWTYQLRTLVLANQASLKKGTGGISHGSLLNVNQSNIGLSVIKTSMEKINVEGYELSPLSPSMTHSSTRLSPPEVQVDLTDVTSPTSSPTVDQPLRLRVDGPFGSASEEVFDYETVILVAAGIGVTPFISILKSMAIRIASGQYENTDAMSVFFYWICRDQAEFESFKDFFDQIIKIKDLSSRLELNLYVTGELNLKNVEHMEEQYNQFSGRPNWNRILKDKATRFKGSEIGVFLCGPPAVSKELGVACKRHSSKKIEKIAGSKTGSPLPATVFKFHKENF